MSEQLEKTKARLQEELSCGSSLRSKVSQLEVCLFSEHESDWTDVPGADVVCEMLVGVKRCSLSKMTHLHGHENKMFLHFQDVTTLNVFPESLGQHPRICFSKLLYTYTLYSLLH